MTRQGDGPVTRLRLPLFLLLFALFMMLAPAAPLAGIARTVAFGARALAATGTLDVAPWGDGTSLPSTVVHAGRRRATTALGATLVLVPAEALTMAARIIDPAALAGRAAEAATAALPAALA